MKDYKELVQRLRSHNSDSEAANAIENLMTVNAGLLYLNDELSKVAAEKSEQIYKLQEEIRRLDSENLWLCRGNK